LQLDVKRQLYILTELRLRSFDQLVIDVVPKLAPLAPKQLFTNILHTRLLAADLSGEIVL
jgi:hypothetical protein